MACMGLLATQCDNGIDPAGASSRQQAGDKGNKAEQDGDRKNCYRIGPADAVKQIAKQTADGEDKRDANDGAERDQPHAFAEDQAQNVPALRAKSEPNSDF